MPSPLNPSITTPRQGDRSHRNSRGPRDLTGREYQRLHAENDARKAAEQAGSIDIEAIKQAEFLRGWDEGFDAGVAAVVKQLTDEGVIDADDADADCDADAE
jgi:hypothetical protein